MKKILVSLCLLLFAARGFAGIGGIRAMEGGSKVLYFPHVTAQPPWWTGIVLMNPGPEPALVHLEAYSPEGTLLASVSREIPPGGRIAAFVEDLFDVLRGRSGWLKATSEGEIVGFANFGRGEAEVASVPAIPSGSHTIYFPHVHQGGSWWTGLVILNIAPEEEEITLLSHNQDGEVVGERDIALGPGQKWVGTVEELFEEVGQVASITVMSQGEVVGFELFGKGEEVQCSDWSGYWASFDCGGGPLTGEFCIGLEGFSGWVEIEDTICGDVILPLQGEIRDGWVELEGEYYCSPYEEWALYRFELYIKGKGLSGQYWIWATGYSDSGIFYMHAP